LKAALDQVSHRCASPARRPEVRRLTLFDHLKTEVE